MKRKDIKWLDNSLKGKVLSHITPETERDTGLTLHFEGGNILAISFGGLGACKDSVALNGKPIDCENWKS